MLIIYNVLAIDDNIIFASTNNNLRRTTDGGSTWQKLNIRTGSSSQGLFYKNNILYITGYLGNSSNLLKSSDLGNNFTLLFSNNNTQSIKKHFTILTNSNLFTITTGSSTFNGIIRSTDDGNNWNYVYSNVRSPSIIFSDNNDILLSGLYFSSATDTSKLLISTNSGAKWKEFPIHIEKKLVIFDIVQDKGNKYFIGTNGYGLYELDIITSVKQEETIPQNFSLSQNYPNPFNPSTVVSYQLAVDSKVNLKVYDVLGNEVASLVNEFKSAGSYNVNFDGSKLSSGIYYYKLTAGDFVQTRKMLLLK